MGELRRDEAESSTRVDLRREVVPPTASDRRPGALLAFLAATLVAAAGVDAALWQYNGRCRDLEQRARTAEQHGAVLDMQNRALRDHLRSSEQHARALHDELLERDGDEAVLIRLSPYRSPTPADPAPTRHSGQEAPR